MLLFNYLDTLPKLYLLTTGTDDPTILIVRMR